MKQRTTNTPMTNYTEEVESTQETTRTSRRPRESDIGEAIECDRCGKVLRPWKWGQHYISLEGELVCPKEDDNE